MINLFKKKIKPCTSINVSLLDNGFRLFKLMYHNKIIDTIAINKETSIELEKILNRVNNHILHSKAIKKGLERAAAKGVKMGRPKQELLKKEKEILELRNKGFIEDEFKMRQKATYARIAKHLKVSIDTVRKVLKKHLLQHKLRKK